jgi:hypothetical protein
MFPLEGIEATLNKPLDVGKNTSIDKSISYSRFLSGVGW